jgi:gluconate 2-dehydrogenase gamma chain
MELNRRDFIKTASLAFGSVLLFPSCGNQGSGMYRFLTNGEALCLKSLCEQIIPRDESPGATDAGVIFYIDRQLAGIFHYNQQTYRDGIKNLQNFCRKKFNIDFELLSPENQIEIMKQMEKNNMDDKIWQGEKSSTFFNLVVTHTMQGFYGSPIHGGNKDYVSFRMLKIDYPLVIGQNRYRK